MGRIEGYETLYFGIDGNKSYTISYRFESLEAISLLDGAISSLLDDGKNNINSINIVEY